MTNTTYDAIIIGAGVMGCSIAYSLARDGYRVCGIDRTGSPGSGSTGASSAVVRFNYSTWEGVATSWESQHAWEAWEEHLGGRDEAGMAKFIKTGGLLLDSPGQNPQRINALFDRAGIYYELWDAAAISARLPLVDPSRHYPPKTLDNPAFWDDPHDKLTGCWVPDSGFVDDPSLAAHNLMAAAQRHGAHFTYHQAVTGIQRNHGRVIGVETSDTDPLHAPIVINAAGPHSSAINLLAGVTDDFTVQTRPMRQEVHQIPAPDGYNPDGKPGPLISDPDLGTYMRGTLSGDLLIGGTEPECDTLQWLDDPDDYNPTPTKTIFEAQTTRAGRRIPTLSLPNAPRGIVGIYDVADDWTPIYDKTSLPGYYVAIGTSGNQFKNAPLVGDLLVTLITACESGQDHDHEPVHLKLPRTGHAIDLSCYSRRRTINHDSSFSVLG